MNRKGTAVRKRPQNGNRSATGLIYRRCFEAQKLKVPKHQQNHLSSPKTLKGRHQKIRNSPKMTPYNREK